MSSRHTLTTRSTFRIVPDSLVFDPALSAAAKEMYAVLLSFAGDTSQAWPGIPGIRERLIARGVQYGHGTRDEVEALIPAERTISGHLAELVERGWVYRRRRMSTSSLTHICQERGEVSPWGSLQQSLPVPAESCSNDPAESRRSVPAESRRSVPAESRRSVPAESRSKKRPSKKETQGKEKHIPSADASAHDPSSNDPFEAFWERYPRRKEPKAAAKALTKALKDGAHLDEILAGAERYAAEVERGGVAPQFVKYPATWLNKGCWADEPESVTAVRNNGGPRQLPQRSGPGGLIEL
jgi:hypothetical protein